MNILITEVILFKIWRKQLDGRKSILVVSEIINEITLKLVGQNIKGCGERIIKNIDIVESKSS